MKVNTVLILILILFVSCDKKEKISVEKKLSENIQISKITSDTLIIKSKSAIIFEPTDSIIDKRKKEVGEEDFYIGADDYLFYLNESNKFLEKQEIKIVQTKTNKILKFISDDKSETIIELNLEEEIWGIYLFDPKLKPKKIDMTATEEEFKAYTK
jgi:hypothetical protein